MNEPVSIVRLGYDRYKQGNVAGIYELLSPSIEIVQTTELPWGGRHTGISGAKEFFRILNEHTKALPHPERFIVAGNEVAVVGRLIGEARRTEKPIDLNFVHVWKIEAAKVTQFAAYIDTPAMLNALQ